MKFLHELDGFGFRERSEPAIGPAFDAGNASSTNRVGDDDLRRSEYC
jgi:hypothetical protein